MTENKWTDVSKLATLSSSKINGQKPLDFRLIRGANPYRVLMGPLAEQGKIFHLREGDALKGGPEGGPTKVTGICVCNRHRRAYMDYLSIRGCGCVCR